MKKLAIVALLVVGCRHRVDMGTPPAGGGGAQTPSEAIERFVSAARMQDYEAMGAMFGSAKGSVRGTTPKEELDKRLFIMMRCLRNDRIQVGDFTATPGGERIASVKFWLKDLTASANFTTEKGPNERWFVKALSLDDLQPICTSL